MWMNIRRVNEFITFSVLQSKDLTLKYYIDIHNIHRKFVGYAAIRRRCTDADLRCHITADLTYATTKTSVPH